MVEGIGNSSARRYMLSSKVYSLSGNETGYTRQRGMTIIQEKAMIKSHIEKFGKITRAEIVDLCKCNTSHANYLLNALQETEDIKKMGKGKIAAQCCHAAIGAYKQADKAKIRKWENEAYAKVVLKAPSLQDLYNLRELARANGVAYYLVTDAGRTQLPKSTVTVLGLGPDEDDVLDKITGDLKLL